MRYCPRCQEVVNTIKQTIDFQSQELSVECFTCEKCNTTIRNKIVDKRSDK